MFNKSPIDGIVSSLKKIEDKLVAYAATKTQEEADAEEKAKLARHESTRASKIAGNIRALLSGEPSANETPGSDQD